MKPLAIIALLASSVACMGQSAPKVDPCKADPAPCQNDDPVYHRTLETEGAIGGRYFEMIAFYEQQLAAKDAEIARLKRQLAAEKRKVRLGASVCPPNEYCTLYVPSKGKGSR